MLSSLKRFESNHAFKSYLVGITTYKAIDPIVFSLTSAYRLNLRSQENGLSEKQGNLFLFNPSIAFAVNDRVTLTTGFQWINRQSDKLNNQTESFRRTSTDLLLGVGYGISKGSTVNTTFKLNASGSNGADLRLNWLHTF